MKCNSCGRITEVNYGNDFTIFCQTCSSNSHSGNNLLEVSDTYEFEKSDFIFQDTSIFSFDGRINRTSFLFTLIPLLIISFFVRVGVIVYDFSLLGIIFFIPIIWVASATYVKRWHDLGKSGWMSLLSFVPFFNIIVLIYLSVWPGKPESNKYGNGAF